VHDGDGTRTRADLTRQLKLARGTATVLVRELAATQLIEELASPERGARGRPTGLPSAHPNGPVALGVDLRDDSFAVAAFQLTGSGTVLGHHPRTSRDGAGMLAEVAVAVNEYATEFGDRLVGVGVAVPSPVSDGRMVQPTLLDWRDLNVAEKIAPGEAINVRVGNDATLAGLAEARRGALRGVSVALHLHIATGIGGVLLANGNPIIGASGAAGEFGHMPLTGGTQRCRCGSVGCWELDAGTRGLLRRAGRGEAGDRMAEAQQIIAGAATDAICAAALGDVAEALGRGIGALVNAHDPEVVGLSGLAARVYQAAPTAVWSGYQSTLMRFRRAAPPPLVPSRLSDLGALTGAAELVFDEFLTSRGITAWRAARSAENEDDLTATAW
jgi:predicted NBD/HSP70 family sugar kinase